MGHALPSSTSHAQPFFLFPISNNLYPMSRAVFIPRPSGPTCFIGCSLLGCASAFSQNARASWGARWEKEREQKTESMLRARDKRQHGGPVEELWNMTRSDCAHCGNNLSLLGPPLAASLNFRCRCPGRCTVRRVRWGGRAGDGPGLGRRGGLPWIVAASDRSDQDET